jgi:hypothetical protein
MFRILNIDPEGKTGIYFADVREEEFIEINKS